MWFTGEEGVDGDGDITRPENITAFRNFVLESTEKRGLHFLMADGVRIFHKCRLVFATASKHEKMHIKHKMRWLNPPVGWLNKVVQIFVLA